MDVVAFGPRDDALGYSRPPVTASFADLRDRGLPEVLFLHAFLPEGVTICDADGFAAMIEEAYQAPMALHLEGPDENGRQRCRGVGNNGIWEWSVVTPGRRSGWRMTLGPEAGGQREVAIEAVTFAHMREVSGATLLTFPISTGPISTGPVRSRPGSAVQFGPRDVMGYRRPPVTVSFDQLSERGTPRLLFVNAGLPEGIIACDLSVFAALVKEAYNAGSLRFVRPDEHGNDQCVGLGSTGIWNWGVVRAGKPIDGDRYAAPHQGVCRILLAPEKDGKRVCTVDLDGYPGHEPEDDSPITFTIRTRPMSLVVLEREAAAGADPADVAEGVDITMTWLADAIPAAYGLLRLLAVLPDAPVPLQALLRDGRAAVLPEPEAAAVIGPLLGNPAKSGDTMNGLHPMSFVSHARGLRVQVHPLARAYVRDRLTPEESAHWYQAAVALIEAAAAAEPTLMLPYARSVLNPTWPDSPRTRGRRRGPGGWRPVSPED